MRTPITTSALRRRAAVALAAAALVTTAACSDDQVTAPKSAPEASAPNATFYPFLVNEVTVRIKDIYGNLIQDGMVPTEWLALTATDDTVKRQIAYDNHLNPDYNLDLNPLLGVMTLKMPMAAKQKVCLYNFTSNYAFDMYQPHCNEAAVTGYKVDLGTLVMRRKPRHTFIAKDWFGVLLPGASYHVTGPFGYDYTWTDGGAGDAGAPDGKLTLRPDFPGTYNWCEVTAPSGYNFTSPSCGTITLSWEGITSQTLYHAKKILVLQ